MLYVHIETAVPVKRWFSRTGKNPSLEDAAGQTCCNGKAACTGGLGLGGQDDSTSG